MYMSGLRWKAPIRWLVAACALQTSAPVALGQSALRDLPNVFEAGDSFTVTIAINPLAETGAVTVEDQPPPGWAVSAISDSGTWVTESASVKWGLFLSPSIPAEISYDVSAPTVTPVEQCFAGIASFDGPTVTIGGDTCIALVVPAVTTWGMIVMALLTAIAATRVLATARRKVT